MVISFLCHVIIRTRVVRSVQKKNPLKNASVMKKLNPYASILKKYASLTCKRRTEARRVLKARREGKKVSDVELKKAAKVLNLTIRKHADYKKELKSKAKRQEEVQQKVAAAKAKRSEAKKAKAVTPKSPKKSGAGKKE